MSVFENLIGERINDILLSEDNTTLLIRTTHGKEYHYCTIPDCCNTVWINHMNGIGVLGEGNTFDILRGVLVTGAEDKGWGSNIFPDDPNNDVIQDGFFTLKTDRGYIDFEVRNSHNGYYDGGIFTYINDPMYTDGNFRSIREDF